MAAENHSPPARSLRRTQCTNLWVVYNCALIGYIHYEAPVEEQNFSTLIEFINAMEVREDDEEFKNPVDLMFDALEAENPNHFAVRQYKKYKI